jgi:predicted ribonuclease toxin of YeeF-YezG toxin-antitoxin module
VGKISKAMKIVPRSLKNLEKLTEEVGEATARAEKALQRADRTAQNADKTAATANKAASKVKKTGTGAGSGGSKRTGKYPATYKRPSGYRKGVRDQVWAQAEAGAKDGKVRDPLTKQVMAKDEPWDMGHKPGHEFRKHQANAAERGIDRKQFLDEHNDPSHYWPELPSSNRSHQGEDHTDDYFGP